MLKKTSHTRRNFVITVLVVAVFIALGTMTVVWHRHKTIPTTPSGVKLAPPTADEKKQADQNKQDIVNQQDSQPTTPATTKKQVGITITSATASGVYATISGILEDGGTCTATFTQGATVVTRTSTAFSNVSYTQCAPITPNLPSAGSWTVMLSYSSAAAEGSSASQALQ